MKKIISLFFIFLSVNSFAKDRTLIFVIGNNEYSHPSFSNAINAEKNALSIWEENINLGYYKHGSNQRNLNFSQMNQFLSQIPVNLDENDSLVFYYSGQMLQKGNENYLIPTDANENISTYISLNQVFSRFNNKAKKIVVLDVEMKNSNEDEKVVFADVLNLPKNTYLELSATKASTGNRASEQMSAFATHLSKNMKSKNSVASVFDLVRQEVFTETDGNSYSMSKSSAEEVFYFAGAQSASIAPPTAVDAIALVTKKIAIWKMKFEAQETDEIREYLNFPLNYREQVIETEEEYRNIVLNGKEKMASRTMNITLSDFERHMDNRTIEAYVNYKFVLNYKDGTIEKGCSKNKIIFKWIKGTYLMTSLNGGGARDIGCNSRYY